ncbi:MAG: FAD-binding protein [Nitriliruptor sp.]|nr:MAG: FAD-binding protein [Nitriliruptor sp.]
MSHAGGPGDDKDRHVDDPDHAGPDIFRFRQGDSETAMKRRVVVVGAGLAGLASAVALERHGVEVVVLEARGRLGGRVHTWRENGHHADLGAERVDGDHRRVHALAARSAVPLVPVDEEAAALDDVLMFDGVTHRAAEIHEGPIGAELDRVTSHVSALAAQLPRLDDPTTHPEARSLDARSVGDLLDELAPSADARSIVEQRVRSEGAVEPHQLSLLAWVHQVAMAEAKPADQIESHRLRGGADVLAEALSSRLSAPVRLATTVLAVDLHAAGVRATTEQGGVEADAVVLAVPPTVVGQLRFEGQVPAVIEQLSKLPMGDITKRLLAFDTPVWRASGWSGHALIEPSSFVTWEAPAPEVLIVYAGGSAARRLATMPLAELVAALPPAWRTGPPPREVHTAHWGSVAETGGAWNAPTPGQVLPTWHVLRRPHGRLHLAGEHTAARFSGFMEGALESAERVVSELAG